MAKNSIKLRAESITATCKLTDTIYCGWMAQNIGTAPIKVYGIELLPGEGISSQDIVKTGADDLWTEPIDIEVQAGGVCRMLRAQAMPVQGVFGIGRKRK